MDKIINPLLVITAVVLSVVMLHEYHRAQTMDYATKVQYVQTTCDAVSHKQPGASKAKCGKAQSVTDTEYVCSNGANLVCWVEVK